MYAYRWQKRTRKYFRTRPRAVAARINPKLRHDVVHHVADALTKFRDFRGLEGGFRTPKRLFLKMIPRTRVQFPRTRVVVLYKVTT